MIYKTQKQIGDNQMLYVKIRLDDERNNGHQDFAITGDVYNHLTSKSDRYFNRGGCIHEVIEEHFPEFKIFINLHLCDYLGAPMYPEANGFYHLTHGFNNIKKSFIEDFCEYYRITEKQYYYLKDAENQKDYAIRLVKLNVPQQWKAEADQAIKYLESLTGEKFIDTSTKKHFNEPTEEEIENFSLLVKSGYYSEEAKGKRQELKKEEEYNKLKNEILQDFQKTTDRAVKEKDVKLQLLEHGGKKALKNIIFYNHSNKIKFNWLDYEKKLTDEEIEHIKKNIKLDFDVTFE